MNKDDAKEAISKVRAGVIGWPIEHSRSPFVHGYWLRQYGINGQYDRFEVHPDDLADFLSTLGDQGIKGVNVTLPHKEKAFQLMDRTDALATRLQAVNTIVLEDDGKLRGSNTDGFGFLENLAAAKPAWRPRKSLAIVLGAGGAARAVVAALVDDGWHEVRISNRTRARADQIASELGRNVTVIDWADRSELGGAELLVNTTVLGMAGSPALEIDLSRLPHEALVNDIITSPLMTRLLTAADLRGLAIVDGLGMLLHQARPGFKAWFGLDPEVSDAQREHVIRESAIE